jgi:hypothetical protein
MVSITIGLKRDVSLGHYRLSRRSDVPLDVRFDPKST